MEFLEDIKKKVGQWVFQRELRSNKRIKEVEISNPQPPF